jgi:hypothetical protein
MASVCYPLDEVLATLPHTFTQGCEVRGPASGHILDQYVSLERLRVCALEGLQWLNVKEVKAGRAAFREASASAMDSVDLANVHYILQHGTIEKLPTDRAATCFACGKHEAALLKCERCRAAYYCDAACQKAHWKDHKGGCRPPQPPDK